MMLTPRFRSGPALRLSRFAPGESVDHSATSPHVCRRRRVQLTPGARIIRALQPFDNWFAYKSRATRNPTRALRVSAGADRRNAERTCSGSLPHEPPRTTRRSQPGLTQAELSRGARV